MVPQLEQLFATVELIGGGSVVDDAAALRSTIAELSGGKVDTSMDFSAATKKFTATARADLS